MMKAEKFYRFYKQLLRKYGPQGWWPLLQVKGSNPTKTGSVKGYHPEDYSYPKNEKQRFEIIIGAVLTQNTAWPNVEKALQNLEQLEAIDPEKIVEMDEKKLKEAIKPAGYFNQKSRYLKHITEFYISMEGKVPARKKLLTVKGIGPETADSILLYAYNQPEFVVDTYTKRIFLNEKMIGKKDSYDKIKRLFEDSLPKDYKLFQEYHALIVEHAKNEKAR